MNDKPISKGDLVMVVRVCCNDTQAILGYVATVTGFDTMRWRCRVCGAKGTDPSAILWHDAPINSRHQCAPISWLKRIDPGILSEDVPEAEKVDA